MKRELIEVDYKLDIKEIKDAIDSHLSYKEIWNRDVETLQFTYDEEGKVSGASLKIWL